MNHPLKSLNFKTIKAVEFSTAFFIILTSQKIAKSLA